MGIDYSGGIIIGEHGSKLSVPDDYKGAFYEWAEENDMDSMAEYYDADQDRTYYGFSIPNILISEINESRIKDVKGKAIKFEDLTGVPAKLIGTQDIY